MRASRDDHRPATCIDVGAVGHERSGDRAEEAEGSTADPLPERLVFTIASDRRRENMLPALSAVTDRTLVAVCEAKSWGPCRYACDRKWRGWMA
jgi:hypothetical protein